MWETATGREIVQIEPTMYVHGLSFTADGRWLMSFDSYFNAARVWVAPDGLVQEICLRLFRNLTTAEWHQYLGNEPYRPTCPNLPVPEE